MEDKRLVLELKHGDKEAMRQIYEKYKDNLMTVATSMLHDVGAAEDVVQDVFVSLAKYAGRLQLRGSLRNYLITAVVNRVRDRFRKKSNQHVNLDEVAMDSSNIDLPEQRVILNEDSRLLITALAKLTLQQREVVILRFKSNMKFKQIADLQRTSTSTVQARFYQGLKKLRAIFSEEAKK